METYYVFINGVLNGTCDLPHDEAATVWVQDMLDEMAEAGEGPVEEVELRCGGRVVRPQHDAHVEAFWEDQRAFARSHGFAC